MKQFTASVGILLAIIALCMLGCTREMITVEGGTLPSGSELVGQSVGAFEIGKTEVTWGEWKVVRDWAVANNKGYDLAGVGDKYPQGSADNFPVIDVNWFDVVKWCNARSEKEGKTAVYTVSGQIYKTGESEPTVSASANGYRLPSDKEWEWAARGGVSSKGYTYSGSNTLNDVGWYNGNSKGSVEDMYEGRGTWPVGAKAANELGIYDMSGNVWEWCEDLVGTSGRRIRGGSWLDPAGGAAVAICGNVQPVGRYDPIGFRLALSSGY